MLRKKDGFISDDTIKCPDCGSTHLAMDYQRGETVCQDCGRVVDEGYIDQGIDWKAYDSEQMTNRARTGPPETLVVHDKGLSTDISSADRDALGKPIPVANRQQLYRLRKWQKRIRVSNAVERNMATAMHELVRMSSSLTLSESVREDAAFIYRKAVESNLVRGRSVQGVMAASIYAACRKAGILRTLDEISGVTQLKKKEVGRMYRSISRLLHMPLMPPLPDGYVDSFCNKLKLSNAVKTRAYEILRTATEYEAVSGRGPNGVAAAAVYVASLQMGEKRTQREISFVSGITEVTLRNRMKEFVEKMGLKIQQQ